MQIENLHSCCYNIIKVIRVDNTKKFTNKADKYVSSRPSYPTKLMDYLYKSKIADIGAGTGIFTRQLLEIDSDVCCLHHILLRRMMKSLMNM